MLNKVEFSFKFYLETKNQGKFKLVEVKCSYFINSKTIFMEGVFQYVNIVTAR